MVVQMVLQVVVYRLRMISLLRTRVNRVPSLPKWVHKGTRTHHRIRRRCDRRKHGPGTADAGAGRAGVARHAALAGRADPEAAAELPADDPGTDEHLHATPQYPRFISLRSGRTAATIPPADGPAVDGAGPATTADLPAAGSTAAAVLPADDPGGAWQLRAAVEHPPLLRQGGSALRPVPHRGLR